MKLRDDRKTATVGVNDCRRSLERLYDPVGKALTALLAVLNVYARMNHATRIDSASRLKAPISRGSFSVGVHRNAKHLWFTIKLTDKLLDFSKNLRA